MVYCYKKRFRQTQFNLQRSADAQMIGHFGPRPEIALIGVSMAMETPPRSELCAQERGCKQITCGQHNVDITATDVKRILFLPDWGSSACVFSGSSALAQELFESHRRTCKGIRGVGFCAVGCGVRSQHTFVTGEQDGDVNWHVRRGW